MVRSDSKQVVKGLDAIEAQLQGLETNKNLSHIHQENCLGSRKEEMRIWLEAESLLKDKP